MIREEATGFVGTKSGDISYELHLKEGIFTTTCEEVLVVHKKQPKMMRPQEVGDGMRVVLLKQGSGNVSKIERSHVVAGMSVYTWFDEKTGEVKWYAYGVERSKLVWIQNVSDELGLGVSLIEGKFVEIQHATPVISDQTYVGDSFLFGLGLVYGKFTFVSGALKHVSIQLPMEGSIVQYEEQIIAMVETLKEQHLYVTYAYQDQKNGQLLHLQTSDQELLDAWSHRLGGEAFDLSEDKEILEGYMGDDIDIGNYVLKFLHK